LPSESERPTTAAIAPRGLGAGVLNTLLLDGLDLPTAMAALPDSEPQQQTRPGRAFGGAMLVAVLVLLLWRLLAASR